MKGNNWFYLIVLSLIFVFAITSSQLVDPILLSSTKNASVMPNPITKANETPSFTYREPYFPENQSLEFRTRYKTHNLEDEWALWGHNLPKFIPITADMHARVNGKKTDEQLCFSSPTLRKKLSAAIQEKSKDEPNLSKYMIMPNDNSLACTCEACLKLGNTAKNASPAVFHLLNELAEKFPQLHFYSSAYLSTEFPPVFSLKSNVGVMISTMSFPKAVPLEAHRQYPVIKDFFSNWTKRCQEIYLWDYAIQFDNYLDAYPSIKTTQKNWTQFREWGVKGIFMQGPEEQYAAFNDLKAAVYAQLMENIHLDIDTAIDQYLAENYPHTSATISTYYKIIENKAARNSFPLDIYGGINFSKRKYLDLELLSNFYTDLNAQYSKLEKGEKERVELLLISSLHQLLEIHRTQNTFASFDPGSYTASLLPELKRYMEHLQKLSAKHPTLAINEGGLLLAKYCADYNNEIIAKTYTNRFYRLPFKLTSPLDEDYPHTSMLNDGNRGLTDYYNNWFLLSAASPHLSIPMHKNLVQTKTVTLKFLQDKKHNIHLPTHVSITCAGVTIRHLVPPSSDALCTQEIQLPIKFPATAKSIDLTIDKQKEYLKRPIALDEIIFL